MGFYCWVSGAERTNECQSQHYFMVWLGALSGLLSFVLILLRPIRARTRSVCAFFLSFESQESVAWGGGGGVSPPAVVT